MSTLGQLKASTDAWLARDDVAVTGADYPQILLVAESNITRDLRLAVQEATATLNFTSPEIDLPADFLEARTPFISSPSRRIDYMTPDALRKSPFFLDQSSGAESLSQFYTLEGQNPSPLDAGTSNYQMLITGNPSVATPTVIEINYWARFPALVNDPDTNWLLQNHFDIYLYASLRAAAEYIQEDVLEDRYQGKYDRAVEAQNRHEERKRRGSMSKQAYGNPRGVI